jgi:hypothetical protein
MMKPMHHANLRLRDYGTLKINACPAKVGAGFLKKDMLKQRVRAG